MSKELWTDVDEYICSALAPSDQVLDAALADSDAGGLPAISVTPNLGKFLALLAQSVGANKVLEIGTLGGYSTIWLARALPVGGSMISLEVDPKNADVARGNLARADLDGVVDVRVGRAIDTLPKLEAENLGPFDFIFIDADKRSNPDYLAWAVKLARKGSMIVIDNVVRGGAVIDAASEDEDIKGVRRLYKMLADDPRVSSSAIQMVGSKGYDGFAIALVTSNP